MITTPLILRCESLIGEALCSTDLVVPSLETSTISSSEITISPSPTTLAMGRSSVPLRRALDGPKDVAQVVPDRLRQGPSGEA